MANQPPSSTDGQRRDSDAATRRYVLLSLFLPAFALGIGRGIATPVLPILAREFEVSAATAALVFISYLIGATASTIPTGYIVDRFGRRKVLLFGPILTAASSFLIVFAGSFMEVVLYRFLAGWAEQMWQISRLTVIADTGGEQHRGRQITSMAGLGRIGTLLGPIIGGFVAAAWGLRWPFGIHGTMALLSIIPSYFLIRETAPGRALQSRIGGGRRGNPEAKAPKAPEPQQGLQWRDLLKAPIPTIFSAQFLANVGRGGAQGGSGPMALFAVYAYETSVATLGILQSAVAAVGIPIMFSAGYVMDRFGRKRTIVPGSTLLGSGLFLMAATAWFTFPFAAFVGAFFLINIAVSYMAGSMQTLGTDIASAGTRGRFFGVMRLVGEAGSLTNPTSFALILQLGGYAPAFAFLGVAGFGTAFIVTFFVRDRYRQGLDAARAARSASG